jgi:phosphate transport system ATP-binding protein
MDNLRAVPAMPASEILYHESVENRDEGEPILSIEGVSVSYGVSPVLQDISLQIRDRRVTAIMGPSGCGKSTLIKTINRTLDLYSDGRLTEGAVRYRGIDVYADDVDPRSVRAAMGIIHQKPVPFPLSIIENVLFAPKFFGRLRRADREALAQEYLEKVGLWEEVKDRLHERAEKLSGGQQQRLCLARTLANRPEVLLMDEPCSALDPSASRLVEDLIVELGREYTIVVVTHNMAQARRVSDDAVFLYHGRLIEQGPSASIFEKPRTALARDYVQGSFG